MSFFLGHSVQFLGVMYNRFRGDVVEVFKLLKGFEDVSHNT